MDDGKIDYRGYSLTGLREALAAIDRERYPRNYENLVSELRARGHHGLEVRNPGGVGVPGKTADFKVRWLLTPVVGVPDNDLGLTGRGRLGFSSRTLHLSGRDSNPWRRRKLTADLPLLAVTGVTRSGRSFRVDIAPHEGPPCQIAFKAREQDAEAIAGLLPAPANALPPAPRGEVAAFEQRLLAVSPRSPVTWGLLVVNVAVFVAMALAGAGVFEPDPAVHVRWGSNVVPLTVEGEWWRLATSMFLHFGLIHLAVNMLTLYFHGRLAERLFGSARFLVLYLFSGLAGSVASTWWNPAVNSAGASGAIFGMLGGLLAFMLVRRHGVPLTVMKTHQASLITFVFYNLVYGASHAGIDNAAHLGGLIAGVVLGLALGRSVDVEARASAAPLRVAGMAGAAGLLLWMASVGIVNSRDRLGATDQFEAALVWFIHREAQAVNAYNTLVERAHAGDLTDEDFAAAIARDVTPYYATAGRRLDGAVAAMASPGDRETRLRDYTSRKARAFARLEQALRMHDPRRAEEAMKEMQAADALLGEIAAANPEPAPPR